MPLYATKIKMFFYNLTKLNTFTVKMLIFSKNGYLKDLKYFSMEGMLFKSKLALNISMFVDLETGYTSLLDE